jgi:hypothetical protein
MKLYSGLTFLLLSTTASAWKVDKRCLQEGQLLVGDEVGELFKNDQVTYEAFDLEDETFEWGEYSLFDVDDEATNLRGSKAVRLNNESVLSFNTTRQLSSGRTFNLKLTWRQGACWQDEWIERKWCMECRRVREPVPSWKAILEESRALLISP